MIKPIKNRIVVELVEKKKVTESGIILTSTDPMEANHAKVLAIGDTVTDVAVGDDILINWNKAMKSRIDGLEVYIVLEEDVILVFENEEGE